MSVATSASSAAHLARTDSGEACRFTLSGRLDAASVPVLWHSAGAQFSDCLQRDLAIDLGGVEHSDSAGVALLVDWLRQARAAGGQLSLHNVPAQMRAIIRVADLENLFGLNTTPP